MVDINLFKDEDEENQIPSDEGNDDLSGDDIDSDDAFNLDELDDLEETGSLADEVDFDDSGLLENEEIPDFDETQDEKTEENYDFGAAKQKKGSLLIWILLAIIVISAFVYVFWLMPGKTIKSPVVPRADIAVPDTGKAGSSLMQSPVTETADSLGIQVDEKPDIIEIEDTEDLRPAPAVGPAAGTGTVESYSRISNAILTELTKSNQLSALLITGNRFFAVEYASETPNVANQMAHRIQAIANAKNVKSSPEERRVTAGRARYYGVISGELNQTETVNGRTAIQTVSQFQVMLRQQLQQNNFKNINITVFGERTAEGKIFQDVLVKTEGQQDRLNPLLNSLSGSGANVHIHKLMAMPSNNTDYSARQIKISLEFRVFK